MTTLWLKLCVKNYGHKFELLKFLPLCQKYFHFNFSQIFNSMRLYANIMFHPCQLKATVEGQQFEHLISCLHYVSFKLAKLKWFVQ